MSVLELTFHLLVVLSSIITIANWRYGLYLIVILDILRDPVRKLSEGHSVLFTLSVNSLWLTAFLAAYGESRDQMMGILSKHPLLRTTLNLIVIAILPGALLSITMYQNGYVLAAIGVASYMGPSVGILIGYVLLRSEKQLWSLLKFYIVMNTIAMTSAVFESQGVMSPVLGGIDMEWVRYRTGYEVPLISGIYRSPDVMGLHAAHVVMFSLILLSRRDKRINILWVATMLFAAYCLMLCGRRKMIGIPIAFGLVMLWLQQRARLMKASTTINVAGALIGVIGFFYLATQEGLLQSEYTDYAQTIATEGVDRTRVSLIDSPLTTLNQSGLLGMGLGTSTQGRYYVQSNARGAWQEDGVGRLFAEFGLFGVILIIFAGLIFIQVIFQAFDNAAKPAKPLLSGLIGVVAANAASFIISHQAYSGDPCTILFVSMLLGIVLSAPTRMSHPTVISDMESRYGKYDTAEHPSPHHV